MGIEEEQWYGKERRELAEKLLQKNLKQRLMN